MPEVFRTRSAVALASLLAFAGCSDPAGARTPAVPRNVPPLEIMPWDALGTAGRLAFVRGKIPSGVTLPEDTPHPTDQTVYVLDPAQRTWSGQKVDLERQFQSGLTISPDGTKAVYSGRDFDPNLRVKVYVLPLSLGSTAMAQSVEVATTNDIGGFTGLTWTADSERIVYRRSVYSVAVESQRPTATDRDHRIEWGSNGGCPHGPSNSSGPISIAPNGAMLFFCEVELADVRLAVLDPGATEARIIYTPTGNGEVITLRTAAWSPDGQSIGLIEDRRRANFVDSDRSIRIMSAAGSNVRTLLTRAWNEYRPDMCWMADGNRIAYTNTTFETHIHVVAVATGISTPVTRMARVRDTGLSCLP